MIKLILHPDGQMITHLFEKSTILIGSGVTTPVDLVLADEVLEPIHVKIAELEGSYYIFNHANDPFVTLNGLSFGKKQLQDGDLIQIGNTILSFHWIRESVKTSPLEDALAAKIRSHAASPAPIQADFDPDMETWEKIRKDFVESEAWQAEELSRMDIDDLISQVEELEARMNAKEEVPPPSPTIVEEETPIPIHAPSIQTPIAAPKPSKGSLKDYYLSDLDDDHDQKRSKKKEHQKDAFPHFRWNWKLIWMIMSVLTVILLILFGIVYFNMSGKNSEEELKAAQGVSDVAMALTYAQMHHIRPQNQNWSDPEFVKSNLIAVLGSLYTPAFNVDSHGQLGNESYLIRIYTSSDLSQFLVIAQPAPSLLQWLIPKESLVVDSTQMEMRKVSDLKTLNRLLLSTTTLDGTNGHEVSALIKNGKLIPLTALASKSDKQGFNPPKALGLIRPGAENVIYNAPRYYNFGEDFLKKALAIAESPSNGYEVELLQHDMKELGKYPHLVLYSSQGMQWAVQAQRALNAFLPNNKLLIAYLKFNMRGAVSSGHLLMDEGTKDLAMGPTMMDPHMSFATAGEPESSPSHANENEGPAEQEASETAIDPKHPLLMQLNALKLSHEKAINELQVDLQTLLDTPHRSDLIAFIDRMENILKKGQKNFSDDPSQLDKTVATLQFLDRLQALLKKYDETILKREKEMVQALTHLYEEYATMPVVEFMRYIKTAGLDNFVLDQLELYRQSQVGRSISQKQIEDQIQKIKVAKNLAELNFFVDGLAAMLNLETFPEPDKLIAYQSEARLLVLDKLNDFLLSNDKGLPPEDFKEENRSVLGHIMQSSWVTDPDEFDYYINEFEIRTH